MTTNPLEVSGPTVEAAIAQGLAELGLAREDVDVEVMQEPSRGILGLGARDAIVRLTRRPTLAEALAGSPAGGERATQTVATPPLATPASAAAPEMPAALPAEPAAAEHATGGDTVVDRAHIESVAGDALRELLNYMGFQATVHPHWIEPAGDEDEETLVLDVQGRDLGVLIGHRGETLTALQYMTRLVTSRRLETHVDIVVDVAGYKARREQQLRRMAQQIATQAAQRHRTMTLEPMPPHERRIVHLTLRNHPDVVTKSVGEGDERKVTVVPKDLA